MAFWDLFDDMRRMQEDVDRVFGSFYAASRPLLPVAKEGRELARALVTGIRETDKEVIAVFEIPGVSKENIELNVTEDSIEVKASQEVEKEETGRERYFYSSVSRSFYRRMPLPVQVKHGESSADYRDGVLNVVMPNAAQVKETGKKIEVR